MAWWREFAWSFPFLTVWKIVLLLRQFRYHLILSIGFEIKLYRREKGWRNDPVDIRIIEKTPIAAPRKTKIGLVKILNYHGCQHLGGDLFYCIVSISRLSSSKITKNLLANIQKSVCTYIKKKEEIFFIGYFIFPPHKTPLYIWICKMSPST